jgi:hypothetical protein
LISLLCINLPVFDEEEREVFAMNKIDFRKRCKKTKTTPKAKYCAQTNNTIMILHEDVLCGRGASNVSLK